MKHWRIPLFLAGNSRFKCCTVTACHCHLLQLRALLYSDSPCRTKMMVFAAVALVASASPAHSAMAAAPCEPRRRRSESQFYVSLLGISRWCMVVPFSFRPWVHLQPLRPFVYMLQYQVLIYPNMSSRNSFTVLFQTWILAQRSTQELGKPGENQNFPRAKLVVLLDSEPDWQLCNALQLHFQPLEGHVFL